MIVENDDGSETVFRHGRQPEVRPMTVYILLQDTSGAASAPPELSIVGVYSTLEAAEAASKVKGEGWLNIEPWEVEL